ncbi:30S ribosomal protein S11 [Candidatus Berkelbacteria bacterium]|nr:30S ribosomal protein S11 [Candidatus Berkelbacteria bacterium]MBI4029936.1 30S ribosomal protein S11 [Candidatus Berkelbacteria bacterium]
MPKTKSKKPKIKQPVPEGRVYINSSFNNTIVTVTDMAGRVLVTKTAGTEGFKGTKKSTPFAATSVARAALQQAKGQGLEKAAIFVSGVGMGREAALRAIGGSGVMVLGIKDITPTPHNGPRPKRPRRV